MKVKWLSIRISHKFETLSTSRPRSFTCAFKQVAAETSADEGWFNPKVLEPGRTGTVEFQPEETDELGILLSKDNGIRLNIVWIDSEFLTPFVHPVVRITPMSLRSQSQAGEPVSVGG